MMKERVNEKGEGEKMGTEERRKEMHGCGTCKQKLESSKGCFMVVIIIISKLVRP